MTEEYFEIINNSEPFVKEHMMALVYFSADYCNVCKTLKPQIGKMVKEKYPNVKMAYIDVEKNKEISSQLTVFSIPTIILFIDGKESARFSRNFGMKQLEEKISRYYSLIF